MGTTSDEPGTLPVFGTDMFEDDVMNVYYFLVDTLDCLLLYSGH